MHEDIEREYKRQRVDPEPLLLAPQEYLELDHCFDPNHETILEPWERPPPMLTTLWRAYYKTLPAVRDLHLASDVNYDEDGQPVATKHPRWYLPTGDIIFNVHNILFRLDAAHVIKHMRVLKDRIENVATTNNGSFEGIPVLDCNGTDARDWSLMCRLLYWPVKFFSHDIILFEDIVRLLRLSRTFKCLRFRDCAIAALTQLFPTSLDHYLRKVRNNGVRALPAAYIIHTINLCLEHGIPHILLMAMFKLAEYRPKYTLFGIEDRPGLVVKINDPEISVRVLQARQYLASARRDVTLAFLKEIPSFDVQSYRFSKGCHGVGVEVIGRDPHFGLTCVGFLRALLISRYEYQADRWLGTQADCPASALNILKADALGMDRWKNRLCRPCASRMKVEMKKGQRALWRDLPETFNMGSWFDLEVLNKEVVEALEGDYLGKGR